MLNAKAAAGREIAVSSRDGRSLFLRLSDFVRPQRVQFGDAVCFLVWQIGEHHVGLFMEFAVIFQSKLQLTQQ